jgi:type IV secretory pathway VirJ component
MNAGLNRRPILAALLALSLLACPLFGAGSPAAPRIPPAWKVEHLPLISVPTKVQGRDEMAVLLTGDGGWAQTDKGLSEALSKGGIPVVGWNSLRYFLTRKSPDRATKDLERILRHYLPLWHKEKVILIGYSFGADVMPFLANRLPPDLAERVSLIVLLGPSGAADFRFHPTEWLGKVADDSRPVLPEIVKLGSKEILCAYGQAEKESLCLKLPAGKAHLLMRPGGHIIAKSYGPIAESILGHRTPA